MTLAAASRYGEEAVELAERHGDNTVASRCLSKGLAFVALFSGEQEHGLALAEHAVELANETGDLVVIGEALVAHALVAQNDLPLSKRLNEEAVIVSQRSGDRGNAGWAHSNWAVTLAGHRGSGRSP